MFREAKITTVCRKSRMTHSSEVKDHIRRDSKLVRTRPPVIGSAIPGMVKPDLWSYLHCRPYPVAQHQRALAVRGCVPRPLTLLVVQEVTANRRKIVR